MTPEQIARIARAVEAKAKAAKSRLAATRAAQRRILTRAAALEAEALAPFDSEECVAGDLALYGRRLVFLDCEASRLRSAAAAMEDAAQREAGLVRGAMRQEIACDRLQEEERARRKHRREGKEEERREALVQLKSGEG